MRRHGQNRPRSRPTTTRITRQPYRYSECNCRERYLTRHVPSHELTSTLTSTYTRTLNPTLTLTDRNILMARMEFKATDMDMRLIQPTVQRAYRLLGLQVTFLPPRLAP
jgi:hypothetical protein